MGCLRKLIWRFMGACGNRVWTIGKSHFDASPTDRLATLCGIVQTQNEGHSRTRKRGVQCLHRMKKGAKQWQKVVSWELSRRKKGYLCSLVSWNPLLEILHLSIIQTRWAMNSPIQGQLSHMLKERWWLLLRKLLRSRRIPKHMSYMRKMRW